MSSLKQGVHYFETPHLSTPMKISAAFFVGSCLVASSSARSWEDIIPFHGLEPIDDSLNGGRIDEADPLSFTMSPSMAPSLLPSASPSTSEPSHMPSSIPTITFRPTGKPSHSPSMPLSMPSSLSPSVVPSMAPSSSPTLDEFAPIPVPSNPPGVYFNYDPTSKYGPGNPQMVYHNASMKKIQYIDNGWAEASLSGYWNEFDYDGFGPWQGILSRHQPTLNRCDNIGKQSPIDVRANGAECLEHHQIRSRVSV